MARGGTAASGARRSGPAMGDYLLRWAAGVLLLGATALGATALGGCGDEAPAPPPAPHILTDPRPPAPVPVSPNPEKRKFDARGELIESVNELYGFRLPVGVEKVRQAPGEVVLRIVTKMDPLVRFYTSRGYQVIRGKGGYTVRHAKATLAGRPDAQTLADAVLYLRDDVARRKQMRFYVPRKPAPVPPSPSLGTRTPAPTGTDGRHRLARQRERIERWRAAHPGEPIPY